MLNARRSSKQRTFEVAPRRGVLYDRNMRELAMTVQVDSIYAVPNEIDRQGQSHLRAYLASLTHIDPADAQTNRTADRQAPQRRTWLCLDRAPRQARSGYARPRLNLKGIYFQKEFQRFYPNGDIAAQAIGYVGIDDNGLGGLEQKFDARCMAHPAAFNAIDARPSRAWLGGTRARPRPESPAHHRRKHSVHGRDRARSRDAKRARRQRNHRSCRTCTPARSLRSPCAPPSTPTTFGTPRRSCSKTMPSATSTSPAPSSSSSRIPPRSTRTSPNPTT